MGKRPVYTVYTVYTAFTACEKSCKTIDGTIR
jgi:hypothetical protein